MDPGGSSTREADNDKKHDEYVAGFRDISKREANHQERKKELRREAHKWIGAMIFKDFDGVKRRGIVIAYEVENGWFKISYKNYAEEEMNKDEVIQRLAFPDQLRPYFNNLPASSTTHRPRWIKKKLPSEMKANVARASNALIPAPKIRRSKRPRKAKQPSTYIPLAVRENKKDDYYWY
ncbi:hypothetical protein TIFTF001_018051 [Ficus carica]|uniref:Uncharacterized protein n=1 Tax=Ficus carica TaxID=3494 RepID=A0AA88A6A6_FICCA|nr:hypothetical protein TIFTF001_018051 [Ficus carica]